MKTYYTILGVNLNATLYEIKKAYKEKVKLYHPDVSKEDSTVFFLEVQEAYDVLSDANKRIWYDYTLKQPLSHQLIEGNEDLDSEYQSYKEKRYQEIEHLNYSKETYIKLTLFYVGALTLVFIRFLLLPAFPLHGSYYIKGINSLPDNYQFGYNSYLLHFDTDGYLKMGFTLFIVAFSLSFGIYLTRLDQFKKKNSYYETLEQVYEVNKQAPYYIALFCTMIIGMATLNSLLLALTFIVSFYLISSIKNIILNPQNTNKTQQ